MKATLALPSTTKPADINQIACKHCGKACPRPAVELDGESFCCNGCSTVYQLIAEANLCQYYSFEDLKPHIPNSITEISTKFDYLADEAMAREVTHFCLPERGSVTFQIPSMHCSACMYVLENLSRFNKGVMQSRVDFIRKEVTIDWNPIVTNLKVIALLLTSLGYEPLAPNAKSKDGDAPKKNMKGLVMRLGVVGFCTGNLMLFSFPEYLGINQGGSFSSLFTILKVVLTMPVLVYGASPYWLGTWRAWRAKQISIDVPLALGISVLFVRSIIDILLGTGEGYLDSLAGLVLFLLVGRWVQARSFDHLRFDQTLDTYFPLAAKVITGNEYHFQKANTLTVGQVVEVQSEMLIPADGTLLANKALIDYSFATGESKPALAKAGERVFAGGRLIGAAVCLEVVQPLARSRFTRLWGHSSFKSKPIHTWVNTLEKAFSSYFTLIVLGLAGVTALYWSFTDPSQIWNATTAVLLVACPCALSLAMPFATHAGMQELAKRGVYIRRPDTLQELAGLQAIVFDKTGTLTDSNNLLATWQGDLLSNVDEKVIGWMARQSAHPLSQALSNQLHVDAPSPLPYAFVDFSGDGLQAMWNGKMYRLGSAKFTNTKQQKEGTWVYIQIGGQPVGGFKFQQNIRPGIRDMLLALGNQKLTLALLSGDEKRQAHFLAPYLGKAEIVMEATPLQKLKYIESLTKKGLRTAMVGDGMNDAGGFAAAHVGIAVREQLNNFSPSCDVIVEAEQLYTLPKVLRYTQKVMQGVGAGFALSLVFNALSLTLAMGGALSPMLAAFLMPVSSLSVVFFTIGWVKNSGKIFIS